MGISKRLKIVGLIVGLLPVLVATMVAFYPIPSALALKAAEPVINYDDPNMATTESYVAEASISCIKQGGTTGTDVQSCMKGFTKPSDDATVVAQKKDDAENSAPSSSEASESK